MSAFKDGMLSLKTQAEQVILVTAKAWKVAPVSPLARARQAPHGYVPLRVVRRVQAALVASYARHPALDHSW
jgi:hypothetical protein